MPATTLRTLAAALCLTALSWSSSHAASLVGTNWTASNGNAVTFRADHVLERIDGASYPRNRNTCKAGDDEAFTLQYGAIEQQQAVKYVSGWGQVPSMLRKLPAGNYMAARLECYETVSLFLLVKGELWSISGGEGEVFIEKLKQR